MVQSNVVSFPRAKDRGDGVPVLRELTVKWGKLTHGQSHTDTNLEDRMPISAGETQVRKQGIQ